MKTVTIHDAKTNLSKYIAAAKRGEDIYIGSFGKPEVRLSLIKNKPKNRKLGVYKGKIWMAPDFDETLPEVLESLDRDADANTY